MNWQPTADNVIIRRDDPTKTEKGIILPDRAHKRQSSGRVVAMGNECTLQVHEGDHVLFHIVDAEDNAIIIDGVEYCILHEKEIRAFRSLNQ